MCINVDVGASAQADDDRPVFASAGYASFGSFYPAEKD
jgi:hypothetical protein